MFENIGFAGLSGIIVVIVSIINFIVKPLINKKLSGDNVTRLIYWIESSIRIVEMIFDEPKEGPKKKEAVEDLILKNFNIDKKQLGELIDFAVEEMNKSKEIESIDQNCYSE